MLQTNHSTIDTIGFIDSRLVYYHIRLFLERALSSHLKHLS